MAQRQPSERGSVALADLFCRLARRRIAGHFDRLHDNEDRPSFDLAQEVLEGRFNWLERGIVESSAQREKR